VNFLKKSCDNSYPDSDSVSIITGKQLKLWNWIAEYYIPKYSHILEPLCVEWIPSFMKKE
jgi:hypothetical protein